MVIGKFIDITGNKYGRLTVITRGRNTIDNKAQWWCLCDCQLKLSKINRIYRLISATSLRRGLSKSCGCYQKEMSISANQKYNTYNLSGDFGIGYTPNGEKFYFDLEDYDKIKNYYWYRNSEEYMCATDEDKRSLLMHRLIMGLDNEDMYIVDHIKHKNHDNRKSELRLATTSQNQMNKKVQYNSSTGVSGVTWEKGCKKYRVRIGINNKRITLGYFSDINDAIKCRKEAEDKYYGKYSYDNSMGGGNYNEKNA